MYKIHYKSSQTHRYGGVCKNNKIKKIPLSARDRALWNSPTVASQFPVLFDSGSTLLEWSGACAECGEEIPDSDLHGTITKPIGTLVVIEAVGVCRKCRLLTPFQCRVRDDLSIEWRGSNGIWLRSTENGTSRLDKPAAAHLQWHEIFRALAVWWWVFLTLMLPMVAGMLRYVKVG